MDAERAERVVSGGGEQEKLGLLGAARLLRRAHRPARRALSGRTAAVAALAALGGLAWLGGPAPAAAQQACAHDICEEGTGLNRNCDPCVDAICTQDPFCCQTAWDDSCIEKVLTVCQDLACAAACSHNPCETGEPLDSTCHGCAAMVCFTDPSCCTDAWDEECVWRVENQCGYQCNAGENRCADAIPVSNGKVFGTLFGASNDGCESGHTSCRSKDVWYSFTPVVDQDIVISSCSTERSFGIDTVVSVHGGCPGGVANEIASNDDWQLGSAPSACTGMGDYFLDSALRIGFDGFGRLPVGEPVLIRVSHYDLTPEGNFELRILPEPELWIAIAAGCGALGALARRKRVSQG
jgi:hypothetical protein